jgi:L-malate glycosyltransferase
MLKVALLGDASSIHTLRWAKGLAEAGMDVHLISQHPLIEPIDERVSVTELPYRGKFGYFLIVPAVQRLLAAVQPDVLNAHYASGYGTTARLVGYRPWMLSVWGSDVYSFPKRSPVHRWWVRKNLMAADEVASTSRCMAEQVRSIAPSVDDITITPFGVDVDMFSAQAESLAEKDANAPLIIGTVKTLGPQYGVDMLIRACSRLRSRLKDSAPEISGRLRLRIVGDGPDRKMLEALALQFGVSDIAEFVGHVPHKEVPRELAKLDIYVALSRQESFGVAVIEASASRRPVVVSDVGGLPEVVLDGETGVIVPSDNPEKAVQALEMLALDRNLRIQMGDAGARYAASKYNWNVSVDIMIRTLRETIALYKGGKG